MNKEVLSTSYFYMWRVIIAVAHADGQVSPQESAYFERVFTGMERRYDITAEQKAAFADDLKNKKSITGLMPYINDPAARGQLIYFAGLLARADGLLSPDEDALIKKLHADQLAGLDLDTIRAEARKHVTSETFKHDLEISQLRPQSGLLAVLDEFLLWLGFDLLGE